MYSVLTLSSHFIFVYWRSSSIMLICRIVFLTSRKGQLQSMHTYPILWACALNKYSKQSLSLVGTHDGLAFTGGYLNSSYQQHDMQAIKLSCWIIIFTGLFQVSICMLEGENLPALKKKFLHCSVYTTIKTLKRWGLVIFLYYCVLLRCEIIQGLGGVFFCGASLAHFLVLYKLITCAAQNIIYNAYLVVNNVTSIHNS